MAYDVSYVIASGYLRFEVHGARRPGYEVEDGRRALATIARACRDAGLTRALGVIDLAGPLPTTASYELAARPTDVGWSRAFRLAIVDEDETSREHQRFTMTVARNRGFEAEVFADEATALAWLMRDEG